MMKIMAVVVFMVVVTMLCQSLRCWGFLVMIHCVVIVVMSFLTVINNTENMVGGNSDVWVGGEYIYIYF